MTLTKRIALPVALLVFVAAVVVSSTGAFFSDTETSTGNTFTAGAIDLKVGSNSTYLGESVADGTWSETDLGPQYRFFDFDDVKPGDYGENTISLHVYNNDAWGRFVVSDLLSSENGCNEPELVAEPNCESDSLGELLENLSFSAWLDEGSTPGFQNVDETGTLIDADANTSGVQLVDPQEGDNILNAGEQYFWQGVLAQDGEWDIAEVLSAAYQNGSCTNPDGGNNYGACQGLALDGRMVGSTTYYFGLEWELPISVGNEVQTDGLLAGMTFQAEQWRNNPTPSWVD